MAEGSRRNPQNIGCQNLPGQTALQPLVKLAKHRWVLERDYEELKQELGLGHYEGRGWRGFHHHAAKPPQGFRPRGLPSTPRAA